MTAGKAATFAEHIQELRDRLMWSMLFVLVGAVAGYLVHDKLLVILQQPLHDTLYYTNPTGAFSFIIKISTVFGLVVALPVIIYHTFAFFGPLIKERSKKLFVAYVTASLILAGLGMLFAYYISLPAALKFLVNFGGNAGNIESLITANEYFNFVLAYIAGFAVLFQLPLVLLFINKLTPLSPSRLFSATRFVILGSFIVAAIITPTPDPLNQALMAGPVILLYFVSAGLVMIINRVKMRKRSEAREWMDISETAIDTMLHDIERPVQQILQPIPQLEPIPVVDDDPLLGPEPQAEPVVSGQPPRTINDIVVRGRDVAVPAYKPRPIQPKSESRLISDIAPAAN
jgi:sec-independent protein translocase protein TatC